jgi:hypothetical protein
MQTDQQPNTIDCAKNLLLFQGKLGFSAKMDGHKNSISILKFVKKFKITQFRILSQTTTINDNTILEGSKSS